MQLGKAFPGQLDGAFVLAQHIDEFEFRRFEKYTPSHHSHQIIDVIAGAGEKSVGHG